MSSVGADANSGFLIISGVTTLIGCIHGAIVAATVEAIVAATIAPCIRPISFLQNRTTKCTKDQELTDAAGCAPGRRFVCTHQVAALFCVKLRHGRHLESAT